jgi:hypothetical protein
METMQVALGIQSKASNGRISPRHHASEHIEGLGDIFKTVQLSILAQWMGLIELAESNR